VQADSLLQVADELYGLVPAQFIAARDEHARQARAAGQRETAAEIKKLARPTASAWLVNQLVRDSAALMERLAEVGQSLQDAQRELAGDRMRELSGQRRQIIGELLPEATRLAETAGQSASPAVLDEVRATLEAAVADPAAGVAVRSGRLTRALAYAGLGEVDLTAAMAVLPESPSRRGGAASGGSRRAARPTGPDRDAEEPESGAEGPPGGRDREQDERAPAEAVQRARRPRGRPVPAEDPEVGAARAQAAVQAAEAAAEAAGAAAAEAEQRVASVHEQRQFQQRRIDQLRGELDAAETQHAQLARAGKQAQRELDAAARKLAAAQRRLAQARERAGPG
jgi:hypothetical protein